MTPTGIEIVSLVLASTGMGGSLANKLANYARKGTAWKSYDQVIQEYAQLKRLREDVAINQYLSPDDKEYLDGSIMSIAFDLMELQAALQELRGTAYYKIAIYSTKWLKFNGRVTLALKLIVDVNVEIKNRSTQGREQARLASKSVGDPASEWQSSSKDEPVVVNEGSASGDSLNQEIVNAMASSAAAALRASLEGGVKPGPLAQAEDGGEDIVSGGRLTTENGLKTGLKWKISPKPTYAPPSLTHVEGIELNKLEKDVD
ncbi:hypothetical protein OPQ81_002183 [Rhizoctonia solani]|nr:hypothetical protein OPQ81_002183 [Rhizoctonia solani]